MTVTVRAAVLTDLGLAAFPSFWRDRHFGLALIGGILVLGAMAWALPPRTDVAAQSVVQLMFVAGVWYPVLEELLFRGVIQSRIADTALGRRRTAGLGNANWLTSALFVAIHLLYQPMFWAVTVIVPSLVFGHMRDRFQSVYPGMALHSIYNLGFVLIQLG